MNFVDVKLFKESSEKLRQAKLRLELVKKFRQSELNAAVVLARSCGFDYTKNNPRGGG